MKKRHTPEQIVSKLHEADVGLGKGLTVRQTESLVRRMAEGRTKPAAPKPLDPNIRSLQDDLSQRLGSPVAIRHGAKGRGKLVISYNSLDELDGILGHIK